MKSVHKFTGRNMFERIRESINQDPNLRNDVKIKFKGNDDNGTLIVKCKDSEKFKMTQDIINTSFFESLFND